MINCFCDLINILQITGETVGEVRTVSDMHQRKAEMARQADAFIALPGMDFLPSIEHVANQMKYN